jgi:hypothetical protein
MKWCASRIDELGHFFLAENRGQAVSLLSVRSVGNTPTVFSASECRKTAGHTDGSSPNRATTSVEEVGLVQANVLPDAEMARRA